MGEPLYRRLGYETIYHYGESSAGPRRPHADVDASTRSGSVLEGPAGVGGLAHMLQAVVGDTDQTHAQGDRWVPAPVHQRSSSSGPTPSSMVLVRASTAARYSMSTAGPSGRTARTSSSVCP